MQIYAAEKELESIILSNLSLSYQTILEVDKQGSNSIIDPTKSLTVTSPLPELSISSLVSQRIKAILASVGWNKNDDVFNRVEMWNARYTPIGTPINKEHNDKNIVGHIDGVSALDADHKDISLATDLKDVPQLYHLVTSGVIYTEYFHETADKEAALKLVEEIRRGEWFVSMETLFTNFDYAIIRPDQTHAVIARGEDTAFLTKVLRCYGGTGIHDGYRVGRLLRNMTFSGKGLVKKPANSASIFILDDSTAFAKQNFEVIEPFGVNTPDELHQHDISVDDKTNHIVTTGNEQMSEELKALQTEIAALKAEKTAKAEVEAAHKSEVEALNSKIAESAKASEKTVAEHKTAIAEKDKALADKETEISTLKAAKAESDKKIDALLAEIAKATAEKVKATRISILEKAGLDSAKAIQLAERFATFSDEQFADIVAMAEWSDKKMSDKKEKKDEKKKADEKSVAEILDDVADETDDEPNLSTASETEDEAEFIQNLGAAMYSTMASMNKNKFGSTKE